MKGNENRHKTYYWCQWVESNHRPSEYESEALTYWATRAQRSGLTITAKEIALPLRHLSAGGLYGISGVTKPQLWLASKLSLTRPGWICTIVLHIISMTLYCWATGIYGGATGNRTPISWETVRYNSRYTIAPNAPMAQGWWKSIGPQFVCLIRDYLFI